MHGSVAVSASRATQEVKDRRLHVMESLLQVEAITLMRCPRCQKMLAKCAARGLIEIACPRCKTLVRNTFI
jgi:hypothetical protein